MLKALLALESPANAHENQSGGCYDQMLNSRREQFTQICTVRIIVWRLKTLCAKDSSASMYTYVPNVEKRVAQNKKK